MTQREFFEVVSTGTITTEAQEKAAEMLAKLDAANEKRRNTMSKTAKANEPIKEQILGILNDQPQTATVVGEALGISTQKASALLRQLAESGKVVKVNVKVAKKGIQKGYTIAL